MVAKIALRPARAALLFCAPLAALLLISCAKPLPQGTFCDIEKPTRLSEQTINVMTDAEVEDALAHNLKGAKLCGWKP